MARAGDGSRRRDYQDNRRRIIEAARQVLAERGPEALTVAEVARRAGLDRTTAYQHFRSRDDLTTAVLDETADQFLGMFRSSDGVLGDIDHLLPLFAGHPEVARLVVQHLLAGEPLPPDGWRDYLAEVRKATSRQDAQSGIDAEMLAYILMSAGVLWPLIARAQYDSDVEAQEATTRLTRELGRLLTRGVLAPESWPKRPRLVSRPSRRGELK